MERDAQIHVTPIERRPMGMCLSLLKRWATFDFDCKVGGDGELLVII